MKRYFIGFLVCLASAVLTLGFSSCHKDDDLPKEWDITILSYMPVKSEEVQKTDRLKVEVCKTLNRNLYIINSYSELPTDIFGFAEAYKYLDYTNSTLLIYYTLDPFQLDAFRYRYYRDTEDGIFHWVINSESGEFSYVEDVRNFTRYAIIVPKLDVSAKVEVSLMQGVMNWNGWDKDKDDF